MVFAWNKIVHLWMFSHHSTKNTQNMEGITWRNGWCFNIAASENGVIIPRIILKRNDNKPSDVRVCFSQIHIFQSWSIVFWGASLAFWTQTTLLGLHRLTHFFSISGLSFFAAERLSLQFTKYLNSFVFSSWQSPDPTVVAPLQASHLWYRWWLSYSVWPLPFWWPIFNHGAMGFIVKWSTYIKIQLPCTFSFSVNSIRRKRSGCNFRPAFLKPANVLPLTAKLS